MSTAPFAASVPAAPPASRPRPIGPTDAMPFGKHKGTPIDQVPADYLGWCLREMDACNPGSDRFWPEFRAAIESVAGPMLPGIVHPRVMVFAALCSLLAARGITISAKGGELITSETITDEELREAIRVHRAPLLAIVKLVEPGQASSRGSARLLRAADLRCRVKAWYGKLSRQFHPDSGGSPEQFVVLNQCYRSVMEVLNQWESKP